jgi:DNA-binding NarL/FixJ family response regulator
MAQPEPTPIALLHGHTLSRQALARQLEGLPGYHLVLRAAAGPELKRAVATGLRPQVLVLSLAAAREGGAALLHWCREELPACRVLVLGCEPEPEVLVDLLLAGAHGFCCEEQVSDSLQRLLVHLYYGALHYPPTLLVGLRRRVPPPRPAVQLAKPLSRRQYQFLSLLVRGDGLTYRAIARAMKVSLNTVLKYRRLLCERFGVRTKQALVHVGLQMGLG